MGCIDSTKLVGFKHHRHVCMHVCRYDTEPLTLRWKEGGGKKKKRGRRGAPTLAVWRGIFSAEFNKKRRREVGR